MSTGRQVVSNSEPVDDTSSGTPDATGPQAVPEAVSRTGSGHAAIDELGAYIRDQRESARLSLRKLAKIAGVSNPYLSQIERGLRKPSAEILQAIAKALEISSETLYVKAGILEEREPGEDLESVVARDPHLSEAQRQALLEMYRSFKALSEFRQDGGGKLRGLLDVVRTGDVDDADVRAAASDAEDDSDTV
jgi:transcriptional regulator with XRE-family HTH domain